MEVPQPKKSKVKLVALGAGISRHADWFVTLGDYLALQPPTSGIYKEGSAAWVFPNLQLTGSPGTTMGNYIRALLPLDRGGHIKYQDEGIVLHDLPPGANAGGIRPGACNQLVAAVPAEFAVNVTGHLPRRGRGAHPHKLTRYDSYFRLHFEDGRLINEPSHGVPDGTQSAEDLVSEWNEYYRPPPTPSAVAVSSTVGLQPPGNRLAAVPAPPTRPLWTSSPFARLGARWRASPRRRRSRWTYSSSGLHRRRRGPGPLPDPDESRLAPGMPS
eukprot:scaffold3929_cov136-Isochrysis_galbana.AAC.1